MSSYRKSLTLFIIFVLIFELLVILVGDIVRPSWSHWSDEWHFQNTIKQFGNEVSLYNLKHYEEMSTPLPFLIYAFWGRLVGFDLFHLRMLSVIIAILTYVIFHRFLFESLKSATKAFWGAVFLVAQPYMIGLSIFVFTDMTAMLFMISACLALVRRRPVLFGVLMALATLSRQYLAFVTLAVGCYYMIDYVRVRSRASLKMIVSAVLSAVPYGLLIIWWGGPTPDNTMQLRYLDHGFIYHAFALSLYVCLFWVYGFPLILFYARKFYADYRLWIVAVVLSSFYILFPIRPAQPTINVGIPTVGLFHRLLRSLLDSDLLIHAVFLLCFLLAMPVLIRIVRDGHIRYKRHIHDLSFLMDIAIVAFLVVMPFSYLSWEKYFVPILPLFILRILLADWKSSHPEHG